MTLEQFAKDAGVIIGRCDKSWGGTWSYSCLDARNCSFCGFRSEQEAYKGWLKDTFGEITSKAILKLMKKTNTERAKKLSDRITAYLICGSIFNPELANHEAVRDLLIECREALKLNNALG